MLQRNVASYLQTLCLVENYRTSFDDLLSLASVFSGDIRRSLLSLQVWLETGSTCRQKMAAPVFGPNVSTVTTIPSDVGNAVDSCSKSTQPRPIADAVKPSSSRELDSGDEFVVVRPRKRRALRVASSDEDSQSLSGLPASLVPAVADDTSHQGCEDFSASASVNDCEYSAGSVTGIVTDQPPVVLESHLAPTIHRLDFAAVGGLESLTRDKMQVC